MTENKTNGEGSKIDSTFYRSPEERAKTRAEDIKRLAQDLDSLKDYALQPSFKPHREKLDRLIEVSSSLIDDIANKSKDEGLDLSPYFKELEEIEGYVKEEEIQDIEKSEPENNERLASNIDQEEINTSPPMNRSIVPLGPSSIKALDDKQGSIEPFEHISDPTVEPIVEPIIEPPKEKMTADRIREYLDGRTKEVNGEFEKRGFGKIVGIYRKNSQVRMITGAALALLSASMPGAEAFRWAKMISSATTATASAEAMGVGRYKNKEVVPELQKIRAIIEDAKDETGEIDREVLAEKLNEISSHDLFGIREKASILSTAEGLKLDSENLAKKKKELSEKDPATLSLLQNLKAKTANMSGWKKAGVLVGATALSVGAGFAVPGIVGIGVAAGINMSVSSLMLKKREHDFFEYSDVVSEIDMALSTREDVTEEDVNNIAKTENAKFKGKRKAWAIGGALIGGGLAFAMQELYSGHHDQKKLDEIKGGHDQVEPDKIQHNETSGLEKNPLPEKTGDSVAQPTPDTQAEKTHLSGALEPKDMPAVAKPNAEIAHKEMEKAFAEKVGHLDKDSHTLAAEKALAGGSLKGQDGEKFMGKIYEGLKGKQGLPDGAGDNTQVIHNMTEQAKEMGMIDAHGHLTDRIDASKFDPQKFTEAVVGGDKNYLDNLSHDLSAYEQSHLAVHQAADMARPGAHHSAGLEANSGADHGRETMTSEQAETASKEELFKTTGAKVPPTWHAGHDFDAYNNGKSITSSGAMDTLKNKQISKDSLNYLKTLFDHKTLTPEDIHVSADGKQLLMNAPDSMAKDIIWNTEIKDKSLFSTLFPGRTADVGDVLPNQSITFDASDAQPLPHEMLTNHDGEQYYKAEDADNSIPKDPALTPSSHRPENVNSLPAESVQPQSDQSNLHAAPQVLETKTVDHAVPGPEIAHIQDIPLSPSDLRNIDTTRNYLVNIKGQEPVSISGTRLSQMVEEAKKYFTEHNAVFKNPVQEINSIHLYILSHLKVK